MKISDWFKAAETADAVAAALTEQDPDVDISDGTLDAMADEYGVDRNVFRESIRYDLGETNSMWGAWSQFFKRK